MRSDSRETSPIRGSWIVVNTFPHQERRAVEHLDRQSFESYCPHVSRQIRHARRVRQVLRPLFPGYVFVRVAPQVQRWRPILSTVGVRSLIRFGDELSFIEDGFVETLLAREVNGAIAKPETPYAVGQEICIAGGPFDGLVAQIIELKERDRLVVLMNLLSRPLRVTLETHQVSPV